MFLRILKITKKKMINLNFNSFDFLRLINQILLIVFLAVYNQTIAIVLIALFLFFRETFDFLEKKDDNKNH